MKNPITFEKITNKHYAINIKGETIATFHSLTDGSWGSMSINEKHMFLEFRKDTLDEMKKAIGAVAVYFWANAQGYKVTSRFPNQFSIESRQTKIKRAFNIRF